MKHPNSGPYPGPKTQAKTSVPALAPNSKTKTRTSTSTIQNVDGSSARHGKIARLPRKIRNNLNRNLDEGWAGPRLLRWLNGLPETKRVLKEHFNEQPISQQNLSQWRLGGYRDWLLQQEARETMEDFVADSKGLEQKMGFEFADKLALWLCMRYAVMTRHLERMDPQESWKPIRQMCRDVVALRRGDFKLREQRLKEDKQIELTEEDHRKWVSAPGRLERLYYEKTHDEKVRKKIEKQRQDTLDQIFGMTPKPDPDEEDETESAQPEAAQEGDPGVPVASSTPQAPSAVGKTKSHKVEQSKTKCQPPPPAAEAPNTKNQAPTTTCAASAEPVRSVGPVGQNAATHADATVAAPAPETQRTELAPLTDADLERFLDQCECGWRGTVRAEECPRCHIRAHMHQEYCVCHDVWKYKESMRLSGRDKRETANVK